MRKSQEKTKRLGHVAGPAMEKIAAATHGTPADFDNYRASINQLLKESALSQVAALIASSCGGGRC
jgi:hypothetical protein